MLSALLERISALGLDVAALSGKELLEMAMWEGTGAETAHQPALAHDDEEEEGEEDEDDCDCW